MTVRVHRSTANTKKCRVDCCVSAWEAISAACSRALETHTELEREQQLYDSGCVLLRLMRLQCHD